jgi:hypothetical protein
MREVSELQRRGGRDEEPAQLPTRDETEGGFVMLYGRGESFL